MHKNLVKIVIVFELYQRTDKQTYASQYFAPLQGAGIKRLELTAILHSTISIHTCFLSTPKNISFSTVISWFCIATLLRLCGLRKGSAILATLNIFHWHWHWHLLRYFWSKNHPRPNASHGLTHTPRAHRMATRLSIQQLAGVDSADRRRRRLSDRPACRTVAITERRGRRRFGERCRSNERTQRRKLVSKEIKTN